MPVRAIITLPQADHHFPHREGIEVTLLLGRIKVYKRSEIVPYPAPAPTTEAPTSS